MPYPLAKSVRHVHGGAQPASPILCKRKKRVYTFPSPAKITKSKQRCTVCLLAQSFLLLLGEDLPAFNNVERVYMMCILLGGAVLYR